MSGNRHIKSSKLLILVMQTEFRLLFLNIRFQRSNNKLQNFLYLKTRYPYFLHINTSGLVTSNSELISYIKTCFHWHPRRLSTYNRMKAQLFKYLLYFLGKTNKDRRKTYLVTLKSVINQKGSLFGYKGKKNNGYGLHHYIRYVF